MNKNKTIRRAVSGLLLCTMATYSLPIFAYTKEETVYSKLNQSGERYNTIASEHLINSNKENILNDATDLLNINNTNGDETYTMDGNKVAWNSNGNDIYYQGESQKELPIECKVTYTLDGKEISAKDIAGKSGKVTIKIEYTNKDAHEATINGKKETLYTPFVVVAGTVVKNENNKNITITKGKTIDEGTQTIVAGMAMPGMQESLGLSKDKVDIPNSIEISMDATDFELNSIISYVTPKVVDKEDIDKFDKLNEIFDKAEKLQSSSKELVNGANTLADGANTLSEKSNEFNGAINKFSNGMTSANTSYNQINDGIKTLNSSSDKLSAGAKTVSNGTEQVQTNLEKVETGVEKLSQGTTQVSAGLDKAIAGIDAATSKDSTKTVTILKTLITNETAQITNLTNLNTELSKMPDTIGLLDKQIKANEGTIKILTSQLTANQTTLETLSKTSTDMKELSVGLKQVKGGVSQLQNGIDNKDTGLKAGIGKLSEGNKKIVAGSKTLYNGTVTLKNGTSTLANGSTQMKSGLNTLSDSANKLTDANNQLTQGTNTISEGAKTLANGMDTFDKEGIQKVYDLINGDAKDLKERVEKLSDLAEQYDKFTMSNDGTESSVKFIMIIDQIKKDKKQENSKEQLLPNEATQNTVTNSEETSNK